MKSLSSLAAQSRDRFIIARHALGAVQKAEIIADIVGEFGLQLGADDLPAAVPKVFALKQYGGRHVAEDEMAVPIAPVKMPEQISGLTTRMARACPAAI
jgi:hypothetical protein